MSTLGAQSLFEGLTLANPSEQSERFEPVAIKQSRVICGSYEWPLLRIT